MTDAAVSELHRNLATLDSESKRQQQHAAHILQTAEKMLETVNNRLAEIKPMTDGDEYQRLVTEKGILEQTIQAAKDR